MVDALAPKAEEGRGRLRKAAGSRLQALIRRFPNGVTHPGSMPGDPAFESIGCGRGTGGTETSQYPEEQKRFP